MCSVYLTLASATFCIVAAQVNLLAGSNTQEDNNNRNARGVDAQLFDLFRQSDGNTNSFPVGPDQSFLNSLVNPSFGSGGAQPPSPLSPAPLLNPNCQDSRFECAGWAQEGECTNNIDYMAPHCKRSCGHCENPDQDCVNISDYCTAWQVRGQCQSNPDYMRYNCKAACKECGRFSLPAGLRRHSGAKPPGILSTDKCPPGLPSN